MPRISTRYPPNPVHESSDRKRNRAPAGMPRDTAPSIPPSARCAHPSPPNLGFLRPQDSRRPMHRPSPAPLATAQPEAAQSTIPVPAAPHRRPAARPHAGKAAFLHPLKRKTPKCSPPLCPSAASSTQTGVPSAHPARSTAPPAAPLPKTKRPLSPPAIPYSSAPESASPKSAVQSFRNPLSPQRAASPSLFLSPSLPLLRHPFSPRQFFPPPPHHSKAPKATANPSAAPPHKHCSSPAGHSSTSTYLSSAPRPYSTKSKDTSRSCRKPAKPNRSSRPSPARSSPSPANTTTPTACGSLLAPCTPATCCPETTP